MSSFDHLIRGLHGAVRLRRAVRGPRRPGWSSEMETLVTVLRAYSRFTVLAPVPLQRRIARTIPRRDTRVVRETDREAVVVGGVPAAWLRHPASAADDPVVMYLHGGGYVMGSIDTHQDLCCRIGRAAPARVLSIDYRLAPEHPYPAQLEDATAAYRWLTERVDPRRVVVAGDSAGGGLTLSLLVSLRDAGHPLPAGAVCISPWTDLEGRSASMRTNARFDYVPRRGLRSISRQFRGGADPRTPLAAPVHAELGGLPPLLIQAGAAETLLDDSLRVATRARDAGVEVDLDVHPDMIHVWHLFTAVVPAARVAIERIGAFVRRVTS